MKKFKMKKSLIIICFITLILLILSTTVYGVNDIIGAAANGVAGLFLLIPKFLIVAIGAAIRVILGFFTGQGKDGLSVQDILFNKVPITDINFFDFNSKDSTVNAIRENVAAWYVGIRNLAAVLLVIVALYVGLRMAMSTIAEDKAKYKQMLIDWVTSICILFLLHYIMVIIISINDTLVSTIGDKQNLKTQNLEDVANKFRDYALGGDNPFSWATSGVVNGFTEGFAPTFAAAVIYLMMEVMTIIFLLAYIKRMITIGFLIIIAPLVTVTYSIDKMGDGKSQALNHWLQEFIYNILIQPFQCITYLALCSTSFEILEKDPDFKSAIIAIAMMVFLISSEKIIKHIFHFRSQSMADTVAAAGLTLTGFNRMTKASSAMFGDNKDSGTSKSSVPKTKEPAAIPQNRGSEIGIGDGGDASGASSSGGAIPPSRGGGDTSTQSSGNDSTSTTTSLGSVQVDSTDDLGSGGTTRKTKAGSRARSLGAKAAGVLIRGNEFALRTGIGIAIGGATGDFKNIPIATSEIGQLTSGRAKRKARETQTSHYKKEVARAFEDYREYKRSQGEDITLEQAGADGMAFMQDFMKAQSKEEIAFRDALLRMRANYMNNGEDEKDSLKSVSEVVNGVVSGEITEQWSPPRFVVSSKEKWDNFMARHGKTEGTRNSNNGTRGNSGGSGSERRSSGTYGSGDGDSDNAPTPIQTPNPGNNSTSFDDNNSNSGRGNTSSASHRDSSSSRPNNSSGQGASSSSPTTTSSASNISITDPEEDTNRDNASSSATRNRDDNNPQHNQDSGETDRSKIPIDNDGSGE